VGVGSGYFLDKCRFPVSNPLIALFDLNSNSLAKTAYRIRRYHPQVFHGDVLQPPPIDPAGFDSIGLNFLLHCVPGRIQGKGVIFDHLKPLLRPCGVIFGSTVVNGGVHHGAVSRRVMEFYNRRGGFSNLQDDVEGLRSVLVERFESPDVRVCGRVARFAARV
jgi:hypothetical protein